MILHVKDRGEGKDAHAPIFRSPHCLESPVYGEPGEGSHKGSPYQSESFVYGVAGGRPLKVIFIACARRLSGHSAPPTPARR